MCQRLSMTTTAAMIEPGRSGLVTGHEFAATQGSGEFDADPLDDPDGRLRAVATGGPILRPGPQGQHDAT